MRSIIVIAVYLYAIIIYNIIFKYKKVRALTVVVAETHPNIIRRVVVGATKHDIRKKIK